MAENVYQRVGSDGLEKALKKFSRKCDGEGLMTEIQKHEFHLTKIQRIKSKKRMAIRKNKERLAEEREE